MRTKAAIYARISNDALGSGLAVDRQLEDCRRLAEQRGWTIVEEYVDNSISASKRTTKRPAYDKMVADFAAGKFSAVVVYDLDRLTRQPRQLEDWIDASEDTGLVLVTATGEADLSTDNGRLFARIKASVARAEIERKGARQRRANEQRTSQGLPVPGRRRYGYESDGITPREAEAIIVRRLFSEIASGASIRSIVKWLHDENIDPSPGVAWTNRRVRDLANNPIYAGYIRQRGQVLRSAHVVPIVDEDLAAEARAVLADPTRRTTPGNKPRHLLSGGIYCGVCGSPMAFMRSYICKAAPGHVSILKKIIEPVVLDALADAVLATGGVEVGAEAEGSGVAALVARHEKNADKVRDVLNDRDEGLIPASVARTRLIELRAEREELETELSRVRADRAASGSLASYAAELLDGADELSMKDWASRKAAVLDRFAALDFDRQREIVRAMLYVQVDKGRGLDRIRIIHKVAEHLNASAEDFDAE